MSWGDDYAHSVLVQRAVAHQEQSADQYAAAHYWRDQYVEADLEANTATAQTRAWGAARRASYALQAYKLAQALAQAHAGLADLTRSDLGRVRR